jgi:uncharacterized protein involved in exopolysaccharide biosynthesis/protein involved in polysaccharide export with SLBB domain
LADAPTEQSGLAPDPKTQPQLPTDQSSSGTFTSFRALGTVLARRRRFLGSVVGGLLLACVIYCLIAPNQYEASARVALRAAPATALGAEAASEAGSRLFATGEMQAETLAGELRSQQLAWRVITELKLYQAPGFMGRFPSKFPGFRIDAPSPEAQAYLLERFEQRLKVQTLPQTLILEIRFRSKDPALSAAVVNALIRAYGQQDTDARVEATAEQTNWLNGQLVALKTRVDEDDRRLVEFQQKHGLIDTPETLSNGQPGETQHNAALLEIDELGRQLVNATADRILREAEYQAAAKGNPELVLASDPGMQVQAGAFATALLQQLHARHSDLEQEESQLSLEHGPNFPRVVEIRTQLGDLDRQIALEDSKLTERFKDAWKTASDREQLVRASLEQSTGEGMKVNAAATEYEGLRAEAARNHELYMRVQDKAEEAGLTAGIRSSNLAIVDPARQPVKPVSPNLPLDLAVTFFISLWLALGGALVLENLSVSQARVAGMVLLAAGLSFVGRAQAPTPNTSGLPAGVAQVSHQNPTLNTPNAKDAPAIWGNAAGNTEVGLNNPAVVGEPMAAPIGPGDMVDVSESHTPEFHTDARVNEAGSVVLPLVGEVRIEGLSELGAARTIESVLVARGMLLHPLVTVLVTIYVGQDVSVLGEVTRPGVYPYTAHHRLLDLISAAAGLSPGAGSLVTIEHRNDGKPPLAVVLDPTGTLGVPEHNPELLAGDTVQVRRAGLVYVVGDVLRPGGFPMDSTNGLTVVQALTLAWGPTPNASLGKALLIREQKGGRTITELNLKRLMRGQDPDLPIEDRDILFVPDSAAKNLWNRSLESVVQSAAGVSIYAGMVYSQRF